MYIIVKKLDVGYQPEIFDIENGYLSGYWQCENIFKRVSRRTPRAVPISTKSNK